MKGAGTASSSVAQPSPRQQPGTRPSPPLPFVLHELALSLGSPGKGRLAGGEALRDTPVGTGTNRSHIQLPQAQIAEFCQRHHIRKLAVFGSALHGDARPDSDLDVLVEFEPGHVPGLFRLAGMEIELSALLGGRKVDLNTPLCLSRFFRDRVLADAEPVYAAA